MSKKRLLALATVGVALALPASAAASDVDVEVQDVCDPVTFAEIPGGCVRPEGDGGGIVTLDELVARLARHQSHPNWRFKGSKVKIREGQPLRVAMTRGGEVHTFTKVAAFGLGCVPPLNELVFPGQDPTALPALCGNPKTFAPVAQGGDLIGPGQSFSRTGLAEGDHRFMCMIHPWMKTTVTVR